MIKDKISRDILREMTAAGLNVASSTFAIVEVPRLHVEVQGNEQRS